jgi:hypothetical protein
MPNHLISNYLAEIEERLEAPYRARAIIFDFSLSLALAFGIAFYLLAVL